MLPRSGVLEPFLAADSQKLRFCLPLNSNVGQLRGAAMNDLIFNDFEAAGQRVLAFLHQRFGFGLWMVTRTEGEDWIVLQSEDHGYGVKPGTVFRWADSFCSEMVKGNGPRIAPP